MAIVFKSNKVANKVLSDGGGFIGPLDYVLSANIQDGKYQVGESRDLAVTDVFKVSRTSNTDRVFNSDLSFTVVPKDTARISYLPNYKTYGLLVEETRFNFFDQATLVSKNIEPTGAGVNIFCCWAVGGSARATSSEIIHLSGDGTVASPQYFKLANTSASATPFVTLSGNVTAVQVEKCTGRNSPSHVVGLSKLIKYVESLTLIGALENLGATGTIVMRVLEPESYYVGASVQYAPYLLLQQDSNNRIIVGRRVSDGTISVQIVENGIEKKFSRIASTSFKNTFAITWGVDGVQYAINGHVINMNENMGASFVCENVSILTAISPGMSYPAQSALTNFIHFNRQLTTAELNKATLSWG